MEKTNKTITAFIILLLSIIRVELDAQYCPQQATSASDDEIFNVRIGTLNNTSICGSVGGVGSIAFMYQNYTGLAAPNLTIGTAQTISVTVGECSGFAYSGNIYVWIDFNQNNLLNDPGELVYQSGTVPFSIAGTQYVSPTFTIPLSASFGLTRMRVTAVEGGAIAGPCNNYNWGETEDYSVNITPSTPCSGAPSANSVLGPTTSICPNNATSIKLANTYTVGGMTYQWQSSTVSISGPFISIPGATLSNLAVPSLTATTYYSAIITCTNSNISVTATPGSALVQLTTTNTVPYGENFEGISANGKLPNCSWTISNSLTCLTYTATQALTNANSGTKYAAFYNTPAGSSYYYTNGILLNAGVTYSTGLMYRTEYYGYNTWSDLSILLGPGQTTTGLVSLLSSNGPAVSSSYKPLSGTFTVASTGIYYVAIKGTSNGVCCANYLSWDDLFITIPCNLNSPLLNITSATNTICSGQSLTLSAAGANSYTWNNGATTASIVVSPNSNTLYSVTGTNSLTGCSTSTNQAIVVNQGPALSITSSPSVICSGQTVSLTASGANTYSWSNGASGATTTITALNNNLYLVTGTNSLTGCSSTINHFVAVNQGPVLSVAISPSIICVGQTATLTANGASTYSWSTAASGPTTAITPLNSNFYSVSGTSSLTGCTSTVNQFVAVSQGPVLSIAISPSVICSGQSVTLTASGASTYSWSNGALSPVMVVTPLSNLVYSLSGTNTLTGCSSNASQMVLVNQSTPIGVFVSTSTICSGSSISMNAFGALTYSWSNGAIAPAITVSPSVTTIYTVQGTNANGCFSSISQQIFVNTLPTVVASSGNSQICAGQSVTLIANGANTYVWNNNGNNIIGAQIIVSPSTSTSYSVTGTNNNGCSASANLSVTVNNVIVSITSSSAMICNGEPVVLTASGASTYSWSNGLTGAIITVTPNGNTTYTAIGTDTNTGCSKTALISQIANACTGVNNLANENGNYQLYPNPNGGEFIVKTRDEIDAIITDALGQLIEQRHLSEGENKISLNQVGSGVYFVLLKKQDKHIQTIKVVKTE